MFRADTRKNEVKAQAIAELPLVIFVIFLLLTIPLVDLVCFSLRYNFLNIVAKETVHAASRAKTFQANVSPQDLSAVNLANVQAASSAALFPEITVNSVQTSIVITNLATGQTSRQNTKLLQPANTSTYTYQIETRINGQTNPIILMSTDYWGAVPGLTAPITVSIASRAYAECPQGLNQ